MIDDFGYPDPRDNQESVRSTDKTWSEYIHTERFGGVLKRISGTLRWLDERLLGPHCDLCGERYYGPRTLEAHTRREHAGDEIA